MKPINSATRVHFKPAAFILMFVVLCSSVAIFAQLLPPPRPVPTAPGRTALRKANSRVSWYFEDGQWRGDFHSFVNLLAYLVRPDPSPLTNQPPLRVEAQAGSGSLKPTQSRGIISYSIRAIECPMRF